MSALEDEIRSQPRLLELRSSLVDAEVKSAAGLIGRGDVTHLLIAARGSSKNAARFAQYVWGAESGILVDVARPLLFQTPRRMNLRGTAIVGISQSGASPDVVNVLKAGKEQGRPIIAITNDVDSPMADLADVVVPLFVGEERAVPSTKTFLACLQSVMQIEQKLDPDPARSTLIERIPEVVAEAIETSFQNPDLLSLPHGARSLTVIGRGTGYAAACEIALKIREVSGITAESFSAAEYLHGPISGNGIDSTVWIIASPDRDQSYWSSLATQLEERGCQVLTLWPSQLVPSHSIGMGFPDPMPSWMFAILATVIGQVAALLAGEKLGRDVDSPEGLLKITRTL